MTENVRENSAGARSWWSVGILLGAVLAGVLLPLSALGYRFGWWSLGNAFLLLQIGTLLASVTLVTGIAGVVVAHRRAWPADRMAAGMGAAISAVLLFMMGLQFYAAASVPAIHNISTDTVDPPRFDAIVAERGEDANPLAYDAAAIAPEQQRYYPWVDTLRTELAPAQALARALEVLENMDLEIVNVDEEAGRVEATDTTFWFGFKDDVVVRVRPAAGGSLVDMRSVSRVGRSDLGVNARRIRYFLERFRQE